MAKLAHNPHDEFFRKTFSRLEIAREFIAHHAPPELVADFEMDTLQLEPGAYVDEELQETYSDILYRVKRKSGGDCYIYLLFEHKSRPEKFTPLQLLGYKVRIWNDCLAVKPLPDKLPPIVALVVYHGPRRWNVERNFRDLVELGPEDDELRAYTPDFRYHLFETSAYDEQTARDLAQLRIVLASLKYIFESDLGQRLREYFAIFREMEEADIAVYIEIALRYVMTITRPVTAEEAEEAIVIAVGEKMKLSIVDMWKLEAKREGRQEGLQEGLQKEATTLAMRALRKRFGTVPDKMQSKILSLPLEWAEEFVEAMFDFQTLKDVTAWLQQRKPQQTADV